MIQLEREREKTEQLRLQQTSEQLQQTTEQLRLQLQIEKAKGTLSSI